MIASPDDAKPEEASLGEFARSRVIATQTARMVSLVSLGAVVSASSDAPQRRNVKTSEAAIGNAGKNLSKKAAATSLSASVIERQPERRRTGKGHHSTFAKAENNIHSSP